MSTTIILILIVYLNKAHSYSQHDFKLKHDRIELASFNKEVVNIKLYNTKYNRTTRSFDANIDFLEDVHPTNLRFTLQGYKYVNNEYKIFPPIRLSINACTAFKRNWFQLQTFTNTIGNFTTCPIKKGIYYMKNYVPPAENLPPGFPAGEWKANLYFYSNDVDLFTISWFGAIEKIKSYK